MSGLNFSIWLACLLLASYSVCDAANEAGVNKTASTDGLSNKALERISIYRQSIRYWDTENVENRQLILKDLAVGEDVKLPGCPRIRYPMICDNDKVILENTCYFRMRRTERSGLLPVMVFTTTPIEIAKQKCLNGV